MKKCLFIGGPLDGKWVNVLKEWDHYSVIKPSEPQIGHLSQQPKLQIIETTRYVKCRLYNGGYYYFNVFCIRRARKKRN